MTGRATPRALAGWRPILVGVSLLTIVSVIVLLSRDVMRQLETLATSRSDNVQWTLSQTELALARLETALVHYRADRNPAQLAEVTKQFDLLYSQVATISVGDLYTAVRADPVFADYLREILVFLDAGAALIDAGEARLRDETATLLADAIRLRPTLRAMALHGNFFFAADADANRVKVSATLLRIAEITVVLVLALTILALGLARLYRISQSRAAALRDARDRIEGVVTTALDAVVMIDRNGILCEFNPGAERIFGHARDEALGRRLDMLIAGDTAGGTAAEAPPHADGIARGRTPRGKGAVGKGVPGGDMSGGGAGGRGPLGHVEAIGRHKSGRTFPVEMSVSTLGWRTGELRVAFIRDVTDRKQREADLREARDKAQSGEQAKDRFIAMMSHEMRTPLNGILGMLQLMQTTALSAKQSRYLNAMRVSGQLLLDHVNDVLQISRSEAAAPEDRAQEPFSPRAMLEDIALGHQVLAAQNGNRIGVIVGAEVPDRVLGDLRKLRQVIINLVANAAKFTRDGRITLSAALHERSGADVTLEFGVADTGIGIPRDSLERIFDDFVRLDNSYARDVEGTGLGLAIARRLTRQMGGDIWADSSGQDGTTLRLRLPLCAAPALPAPGQAPQQPGQGRPLPRREILVVEDNEINRLVMREMLAQQGHRVTEARDGVEGVAAAARRRFDVIFMDVSMPRLDGIGAARAIRAGTGPSRRAPIVAVTAHALPSEISVFMAAGMNAVLSKPLTFAGIEALLQDHAGGAGAAPGLDPAVLSDLREALPAATLRALLARFTDEMDALLADLPASVVAGADEDRIAAMHRLAGAAAMFGAAPLRAALCRVEDSVRSGARCATGDLAAEWVRTRADIGTLAETLEETSHSQSQLQENDNSSA